MADVAALSEVFGALRAAESACEVAATALDGHGAPEADLRDRIQWARDAVGDARTWTAARIIREETK